MIKHGPDFSIRTKRAALAGNVLLALLLPTSQAQPAPLAGAVRQLKPHQIKGALVPVGTKVFRDRQAVAQYRHHQFRFRYAGAFPGYRYGVLDDNYDGADYYPPQPHYFSHRYNWYPPLATFRYPDGPWYAW